MSLFDATATGVLSAGSCRVYHEPNSQASFRASKDSPVHSEPRRRKIWDSFRQDPPTLLHLTCRSITCDIPQQLHPRGALAENVLVPFVLSSAPRACCRPRNRGFWRYSTCDCLLLSRALHHQPCYFAPHKVEKVMTLANGVSFPVSRSHAVAIERSDRPLLARSNPAALLV